MIMAFARAGSLSELQRYAICVGLPLVAVFGVVAFGNPLFDGNDDAGLAMLGAGFGLAVEPEPHLIFSHFGYGILLGIVSQFAGPCAHGWTTLAALGLSMGLYARALCEQSRPNLYLVAAAAIIAVGCVFTRALLLQQFTSTAAVLFGAAIGCWLAVLRSGARSPWLRTVIYMAIVLSFLIRPLAVTLGLVVVVPALIWLAWLGPVNSRRPTLRLMAVIAAMAAAIYVTDNAAYALSPDWRDALTYNQVRSLFNDYFRIPWIPGAPEYAKVGWSENDYAMFMNWYFLHPIFDYDNVNYLARTLLTQAPLFVPAGVRDWLWTLLDSPLLIAICVGQLLLLALLPPCRVIIVLLMIGTFFALAISGLTGRPPLFRVQFSALSVSFLCMLPFLLAKESGAWPLRSLAAVLLLGIALYAGWTVVRAHRQVSTQATAYRAKLLEAHSYFTGTVISWGSAFVWEWLITPTKVYAPVDRAIIPSIGVATRMPVTQSTLERLGIRDLGVTLCTKPDIRVIASTVNIKQLQKFCEEHYQTRPTYNLVFSHPMTEIHLSGIPEQLQ
jgi:hypothetical protein